MTNEEALRGSESGNVQRQEIIHAHRLGSVERFTISYTNERTVVGRLMAHDVVQRLAVRKGLAGLLHAIELRCVGPNREQLALELVRDVDDERRLRGIFAIRERVDQLE